jgi:hypothetical protein
MPYDLLAICVNSAELTVQSRMLRIGSALPCIVWLCMHGAVR